MNVATDVSKLVNFVRSNEMNRRQLKDFLNGMESEYVDSLCCTEVH